MIVFLIFILLPVDLHAKDTEIYTVQTGSFTVDTIAEEHFNSLLKAFDKSENNHLRIEKVGDFYAVRVGKFRDHAAASKFLQSMSAQVKEAIILKAYFNEENFIKSSSKAVKATLEENKVKPTFSTDMLNATITEISQDKKPAAKTELIAGTDENLKADDTNNTSESTVQPLRNRTEKKQKKYEDIHGRVYISDYYSNDSNNFDFHVLSSRLKVYQRENDNSRYYFKFDGRARMKVSDNDVHNDIPEFKLYEIWIGYKFPVQRLDVITGRQHILEMYNTSVDGINTKFRFRDDIGIGIFAGLAPDKYDYSFNSKFKTAGVYSFLDRDRYKLKLGYEKLFYDGKTDREYLSFKLYSDFNKKMWFNLLSSASINQIINSIDVDNMSTNLLYKFSRDLRVNFFFNYYRAIRYFESSKKFISHNGIPDDYYLDTNPQSRLGVRINYRLLKKLTVYTSAAYQHRDIDDESATRFTGGFRAYDLRRFNLSGRYTRINNFTSKSNEFNLEVSRFFLDKFDVSVYASHEQEELDIENGFTAGLLTYGASLYWTINKHYFISMFLERYDEDDYDNTSMFTQGGYRF
ncbi:MAG: SPOR domain-containing protein [Nitrospiraceae bacterium]|nr:MAG: SPOR domain-containing protein [Nitrospiraceae bacterium]